MKSRNLSRRFSKKWIPLFLVLSAASLGQAQTWTGASSNVWDNLTNWSPTPYPNDPSAAATFDSSAVTNLILTNSVTVGSVTFTAAAPSYTIDTSSFTLSLQGSGIGNGSGTAQHLINGNGGVLDFLNSASAGDAAISIAGGNTYFFDSSTASTATLQNNGYLEFNDSSTAANAGILNLQTVNFKGGSTAANASVTNNQVLAFKDTSSAGSAVILNNNNLTVQDDASLGGAQVTNAGILNFRGNGTAASSAISSTGTLAFYDYSTAGAATLLDNGGIISFGDHSSGGTSRIIVTNGGQMTIDDATHVGAVTVGSIEGSGSFYIGKSGLAEGGNNLSTTVTGVIDDGIYSGSFTKLGTGTLTLTGTNTYDAGTSILGGSLVVDTGGQLGSGLVFNNASLQYVNGSQTNGLSIVNNLTLDFSNNSTAQNSQIANSGNLGFWDNASAANAVITGNGAVSFNNTSTAASATLAVNSGGSVVFNGSSLGGNARLLLNAGGALDLSGHSGGLTLGSLQGAGGVSLGANALIEGVNQSSTTLSGVVSGSGGSLVKKGSGTLTLSGTNTYTGGTAVLGGALQIYDDSNLGAAGGALSLTGTTLRTLGSVTSSRSLVLDLGGGGTWDSNGFDSTLDGILSGGSFLKTGAGTLTLNGSNTYSGGTQVNGGALLVGNGNALGTGPLVLNSGTLGTSGGPLTISLSGDYTQGAAGTLRLGVGAIGTGDFLNLTGLATLNGTLSLFSYNNFQPAVGESVTLLYANNGIAGRFNDWTNPAGVRWYPLYQPYEVLLLALPPSFAALGLTPNQKSVGSWLDDHYQLPSFETLVLSLGSPAAGPLPGIFDLIAPEELTAIFPLGYATAQTHLAFARQASGKRNGEGNAASAFAMPDGKPWFAADLPAPQLREMAEGAGSRDEWEFFLQGGGSFGTVTGDGNAGGFSLSTSGLTAGLSHPFDKTLAGGLLLGYAQAGGTAESLEMGGGQLGLFGDWHPGGIRVTALGEAGINSYKTHRAAYGGTATGQAQGQQFSGGIEAGFDGKIGALTVGPYASGQWTLVQIDAFTEQGSLAPLAFPGQNQTSLRSEAGVRAGWNWKAGSLTLRPSLSAAWGHQFQGSPDNLTAGLSSGGPFTVQGPVTGSEEILLGAGLSVPLAPGLSGALNYRGIFARTHFDSQSFSGGLALGF